MQKVGSMQYCLVCSRPCGNVKNLLEHWTKGRQHLKKTVALVKRLESVPKSIRWDDHIVERVDATSLRINEFILVLRSGCLEQARASRRAGGVSWNDQR